MFCTFAVEETNSIGLTVTEVGTHSAQVVWVTPVGETVIGYNISLKEITTPNVFVYGYITQNTNITLDSLDPDHEYSICVEVLTSGATEISTASASFRTLSLGGKLIAAKLCTEKYLRRLLCIMIFFTK